MHMMPCFTHRSCYVNFAEHLQNRWNPNLYYRNAPNQWSADDWERFLQMIKAFGFNILEYWVPPTLFNPSALRGEPVPTQFAATMRRVTDIAHRLGLKTKFIVTVNTIGAEWFFACPHIPEQKELILSLWRHWARELAGTDIVSIFPGDPGGCNRNCCTHETFVDLSLELCDLIRQENPRAQIEINTWGTPFTGWGSDLWHVPDWDGSWKKLIDEKNKTPDRPLYIWNGKSDRTRAAMEYFLKRLSGFPADCLVGINLGFSPDGDPTHGGDARPWAREVAKHRQIVTWDYSVSEGELICYPHWRLPRLAARRREERTAAPYSGGMNYTMSPKLNLLTFFAAGQLFINPDADPDQLSRNFCAGVFGEEHARLGELFEAFEVVPGWGHHPRRLWSKPVLRTLYAEMIERLEAADVTRCSLPLFPDPETYRQDLLWFARAFHELAGDHPDRVQIRKAYWKKALAIYDSIPMSADERAEHAAHRFADLLS